MNKPIELTQEEKYKIVYTLDEDARVWGKHPIFAVVEHIKTQAVEAGREEVINKLKELQSLNVNVPQADFDNATIMMNWHELLAGISSNSQVHPSCSNPDCHKPDRGGGCDLCSTWMQDR